MSESQLQSGDAPNVRGAPSPPRVGSRGRGLQGHCLESGSLNPGAMDEHESRLEF